MFVSRGNYWVLMQDVGEFRLETHQDWEGSESKAESSTTLLATTAQSALEVNLKDGGSKDQMEGGDKVCIYVHDLTLETSLKRAFADTGCHVTTLRYRDCGAADADHASEVLNAAARGQVFVTAGVVRCPLRYLTRRIISPYER